MKNLKILEGVLVFVLGLTLITSCDLPVADNQPQDTGLQVSNKKPPKPNPRGSGRREWMIK